VDISFLTEKLPYSQICDTKVGPTYKKRRQSEKLVGPSSKFVVVAFIIGDNLQKMENAQVKCAAKLCLISDTACQSNIRTKNTECDANDDKGKSLAAYKYIANAIPPTLEFQKFIKKTANLWRISKKLKISQLFLNISKLLEHRKNLSKISKN